MPYLIAQNPDDTTWTWKLVVDGTHEIASAAHPFPTEADCREGIEQVRREAKTMLVQYETPNNPN